MALQEVQAVWAWAFGPSAQKATYGRFADDPADKSFTKDFLQVSGTHGRLLASVLGLSSGSGRVDFDFHWPTGSTPGFLVFSADRHHLSWPTGVGGPAPWRLTPTPSAAGPETLPGDPTAKTQVAANAALAAYGATGLNGVLVAVKLSGEADKLHIRAYVETPPPSLNFAATSLLPPSVRTLTTGFTQRKACQSTSFPPGGLYFDPDRNHDAWSVSPVGGASAGTSGSSSSKAALPTISSGTTGGVTSSDDSVAEVAPSDDAEVSALEVALNAGNFAVPDAHVTAKTRGSAQRVFAKLVKSNYGNQCAVTGIRTKEFLVASHIVPWADDQTIRIDPSNGICLSTLIDRAFDSGFLSIGVDSVVTVHLGRLAGDPQLAEALKPYQGVKLAAPSAAPPNPKHLARRLELAKKSLGA